MADFWSNLTGGKIHSGSWLGGILPDLGATEALAQSISSGSTTDLSDALKGSNKAQEPIITGNTSGDTMANTNTGNIPTGTVYKTPTTTQSTGGGMDALINAMISKGYSRENAIATINGRGYDSLANEYLGSSGGGSDPYASVRNEISSGYDSYIGKLNDMLSGLPGQAENQNQIVNNQFTTSQNTLNNQQESGLSDLASERTSAEQNQSKNLKDLSENIRNMFMSGNVYLGSRGAGDSSAANQYAYALTKQGNKARGDLMSNTSNIMAEINKRETNLKNTVATELKNLATERDSKLLEISNWLAEQQNAVREKIGQAGLSKSTDLANLSKSMLDQALSAWNTAQQEISNKKSMLEEWAANNATTISQLKSNLSAVSSYSPSLPSVAQFSGTPTISGGNYSLPINWSTNAYSSDEDKSIF